MLREAEEVRKLDDICMILWYLYYDICITYEYITEKNNCTGYTPPSLPGAGRHVINKNEIRDITTNKTWNIAFLVKRSWKGHLRSLNYDLRTSLTEADFHLVRLVLLCGKRVCRPTVQLLRNSLFDALWHRHEMTVAVWNFSEYEYLALKITDWTKTLKLGAVV